MNTLHRHSQSPATGALRSAGHAQRVSLTVAAPRKSVQTPPLARTGKTLLSATAVAADGVAAPTKVVHPVTAESYRDFLAENAEKLVMMDFYAVWCGPCKVIAPEIERMAAESDPEKLVFAKFDCGATDASKRLAMSLGIKALPTFHLYRNCQMVDSMTGAKLKSLQEMLAKHT
ncbi:hypothetical protein Agub_g9940 [Astrephomene gubernaculifera]|uniref:Thioredoxin domain-containing protein n=1 Tax=Astrephomene gubernaculifera TaxID=47775 RepID=A0AAD3DU30_9CHLO|nr:hypothetical protein Agub_g9940 [Astrephomene gubernaculifera]